MRLPHTIINRLTLVASSTIDLCTALGDAVDADEIAEIKRLCDSGLPPVTSLKALSVMTGYNPGFVWSLLNKTTRYYRVFQIPKGHKFRQIEAPRVALKLIQKWLSVHLSLKWKTPDEVHGFVSGRSHLTAASAHLGAEWILSIDLENFFPSISSEMIAQCLRAVGYQKEEGLEILVKLLSFQGRLSQGAPTSPIISNIALSDIDRALTAIARARDVKFTRYADDITFSGKATSETPESLLGEIRGLFNITPWNISEKKVHIARLPQRLKVHGLLVHGEKLRLTKGYRNQVRAYKHLRAAGRIANDDLRRLAGHIEYAHQVEQQGKDT